MTAGEALNWREQRLVDAITDQGSLICWETRIPSRKHPGTHRLDYTVDLAGPSTTTIQGLLARGIVRFEFVREGHNGVTDGKLFLSGKEK